MFAEFLEFLRPLDNSGQVRHRAEFQLCATFRSGCRSVARPAGALRQWVGEGMAKPLT